jgi:hypothetical protein
MTYDNPNNRKDKVVRFRISEADRERINQVVRARRTYLTDYLRSAVMDRVEFDEERISQRRAELARQGRSQSRRSVV